MVTLGKLEYGRRDDIVDLLNEYKTEIGESRMSLEDEGSLANAIREGRIAFYYAENGTRNIGMCSIVRTFSTFTFSDISILEDFYVKREYRKQGVGKSLVRFALEEEFKKGVSVVNVSCADCDLEMYAKLGFDQKIGNTLAHIKA